MSKDTLQKHVDEIRVTYLQIKKDYTDIEAAETAYNKAALEFFDLNNSESDLPCFVVFSRDINNPELFAQRAFRINGKTEDEFRQSLVEIVSTIADIERTIRDGSADQFNDQYIFGVATKKLDQMEVGNLIRKSLPGVSSVASFFAIIEKKLLAR